MKWGELTAFHSCLLRQAHDAEKGHDVIRLAYLRGEIDALEFCFPQTLGRKPGAPCRS